MHKNHLGKLDYVQFIGGGPKCKIVSPDRLRQPINMRLFQQHTTRMIRDAMEQVVKAKVIGRSMVLDEMKARMGCGKSENFDGECGLSNCYVCEIDAAVEFFDEHLKDFCSMSRNHDAFAKGVGLLEDCCLMGKKEPSVLVTNKKWVDGMTKLLMEAIRKTLEVYGTVGELNVGELQKMFGNLDYVYERLMAGQKSSNAKYTFEILNENSENETPLKLMPIQDFFSEEELEEHMASLTVEFRVIYGTKQVPSKAAEWDGRVGTAEGVLKVRPQDAFLVKTPHGAGIGKQILSAGLFDTENGIYYGMQPDEINYNNKDPLLQMVPNRRSVGNRLIIN